MNENVDSKKVLMNFPKKTLDQIQSIKDMTGIDKQTRIVLSSIEIAHEIAAINDSGGKVFIEKENGERFYLKVIGY